MLSMVNCRNAGTGKQDVGRGGQQGAGTRAVLRIKDGSSSLGRSFLYSFNCSHHSHFQFGQVRHAAHALHMSLGSPFSLPRTLEHPPTSQFHTFSVIYRSVDSARRKMTLVAYSDSEDEHDEPVAKRSKTEAADQKDDDDLPPLPASFLNLYSSSVRVSNTDDPSLHHGRKRVVKHVEGNWPTHVYLECMFDVSQSIYYNSTKTYTAYQQGCHPQLNMTHLTNCSKPCQNRQTCILYCKHHSKYHCPCTSH
jgi:hypothetical protein